MYAWKSKNQKFRKKAPIGLEDLSQHTVNRGIKHRLIMQWRQWRVRQDPSNPCKTKTPSREGQFQQEEEEETIESLGTWEEKEENEESSKWWAVRKRGEVAEGEERGAVLMKGKKEAMPRQTNSTD